MFTIIEMQTNGGVTNILTHTAPTKSEAMSIYHTILASAELSKVDYHTCVVLDVGGNLVAKECCVHVVEEQIEE